MHARNVDLVFGKVAVHVSTQFHVSFDPELHTVKKYDFDSLLGCKERINEPNRENRKKWENQREGENNQRYNKAKVKNIGPRKI